MPAPEEPEESASSPSSPGDDPAARAIRRALPQPLSEGPLSFFRRKGAQERPQPAPGLAAGKVVGDFRLVSMIGQGGMGQIWEAEQLSLHRTVAVKFVRPECVTERQLELFAREARAGGRLSHPGLVTVYGHGESEALAWIAMEYVGGGWTLKDFLDEVARAPEAPAGYDREVARLVAEIAEAMETAHEAGVIHRDLKPGNVLITAEDRPKVTDFGLARISDEAAMSETGDLAGTYLYMSPEQVEAKRSGLDHRSDIFSLGVVLYELLALRRPFEGDTLQQVADQILSRDPPDPRTIRSKVPRDLAVIAGKALEKERERRYATMKELAADLRRYLANESIHATPPTRTDQLLKWIKRNPGKSSAAAIVAVTFTVIALLLVANVRTNRALATKTTEAEASAMKAREQARIAGENERLATTRTDEVLRLSAFQRLVDLEAEADRLWPAEPEKLPQYERWLERARELVAGLDPQGDGPGHRAQLAKLRERAVPLSEEEREERRRAHPRFVELAPLEARVAALHAAKDVRDGNAQPATVAVDASALPSDAAALDGLAWPLVDPLRTVFGREAEGLALARLAIERVEDDESAARAGKTLAWALFACGLDKEALQEAAASLEAAPPEQRAVHEDEVAQLNRAVDAARRGAPLAKAEAELAALRTEISSAGSTRFADEQDTWWHNQLQKLVAEIEAFANPQTGLITGVSPAHGWGIERRRAFAAEVAERFVSGEEAQRVWSAAIASIADPEVCPRYAGLRITPQLGLLPIGPDPDSNLWEFAHLQTGEPAVRGADGKLVLTEEKGLVFVLLPGGTFRMGAQSAYPNAPGYFATAEPDEAPVRIVSVAPFFLSKYEMTQGQWSRSMGENPSHYSPENYEPRFSRSGAAGNLLHPVEQVSWTTCRETCRRLGLVLPREVQWEYGARGCRAPSIGASGPAPDGRREPWRRRPVDCCRGSSSARPRQRCRSSLRA